MWFSLHKKAEFYLISTICINVSRYFERAAKTDPPKSALSWGRVDMRTFAKSLIELCNQTRGFIIQEPRLVKLASPTYILGE